MSTVEKELLAIAGYIRINYYNELNKTESLAHNTMIDNGIILIIHNHTKPLLLVPINARELSKCTIISDEEYNNKYNTSTRYQASYMKEYRSTIKVVLIGTRTAGKTCLLTRHMKHEFPQGRIPCLYEGPSTRNLRIENHSQLQVFICDTTSKQDCIVPDGNYKGRVTRYIYTNAFMICMSVYDHGESDRGRNMDKSGMWTDLAVHTMAFCQEVQALCPSAVRILVGTRIDLRDDSKYKDKCYTKEEMEMFADLWDCHAYVECSALNDVGVRETFDYVTRKTMQYREQLLDRKRSKSNCVIL